MESSGNNPNIWKLTVALVVLILISILLMNVSTSTLVQDSRFSNYIAPTGLTKLDAATGSQPSVSPNGIVHGSFVDENDSPIRMAEVELIPLNRSGAQQWYATEKDWTSKTGEYEFPNTEPGEYIVAIQIRSAPTGDLPFLGKYYPGETKRENADPILVVADTRTELHPVRLTRVKTVTIRVNVSFESGGRPEWSNLLFHNPKYHQAVIGDTAPGVTGGIGTIQLPVGFEYIASATAWCDGGPTIDTRESPRQSIEVSEQLYPEELHFVIPGTSCRLWEPHSGR